MSMPKIWPRGRGRVSSNGGKCGNTIRSTNSRGKQQLLLFIGAYLLYNLARWAFVGNFAVASEHAQAIWQLEQSGGLAVEQTVQIAFSSEFWTTILNCIYLLAQLAVLPGTLLWLYFHNSNSYQWLRNTIVATWLISIPIFALFPVAPPRLVAIGLLDTVGDQMGNVLNGHSTIFYNPFAAMPSLHVGFAFAIGYAVSRALVRPWAKALALCWGPLVTLSVLATGNHFILDAVAGVVITTIGVGIGWLVGRWLNNRSTVTV